jgi:transcriptional regulator with XRE-family HTH domain
MHSLLRARVQGCAQKCKAKWPRRRFARKRAGVQEPLIDPRHAAARARAAIGYAGLNHAEVEKRTGLDVAMIRRITAKKNPRDARIERLWAIADACDVPRGFMERGFEALAEAELAEKVEQMALDLEALRQRVEVLGGQADSP